MKNFLFFFSLLFSVSSLVSAQENLVNTFSSSYAKETESNYNGAITLLKNNYSADNYFINLRLGWLYYNAKNYQSSVQYYELAIKLKPTSVEALLGLAGPTYALKKWEVLNVIYKKVIVLDPNNTTANYRLGISAYYSKQFIDAEKYAGKVLKLYPFDYDSNLLMAGSKLSLAKITEAKVYYTTVLLIRPTDATAKQILDSLK